MRCFFFDDIEVHRKRVMEIVFFRIYVRTLRTHVMYTTYATYRGHVTSSLQVRMEQNVWTEEDTESFSKVIEENNRSITNSRQTTRLL